MTAPRSTVRPPAHGQRVGLAVGGDPPRGAEQGVHVLEPGARRCGGSCAPVVAGTVVVRVTGTGSGLALAVAVGARSVVSGIRPALTRRRGRPEIALGEILGGVEQRGVDDQRHGQVSSALAARSTRRRSRPPRSSDARSRSAPAYVPSLRRSTGSRNGHTSPRSTRAGRRRGPESHQGHEGAGPGDRLVDVAKAVRVCGEQLHAHGVHALGARDRRGQQSPRHVEGERRGGAGVDTTQLGEAARGHDPVADVRLRRAADRGGQLVA